MICEEPATKEQLQTLPRCTDCNAKLFVGASVGAGLCQLCRGIVVGSVGWTPLLDDSAYLDQLHRYKST